MTKSYACLCAQANVVTFRRDESVALKEEYYRYALGQFKRARMHIKGIGCSACMQEGAWNQVLKQRAVKTTLVCSSSVAQFSVVSLDGGSCAQALITMHNWTYMHAHPWDLHQDVCDVPHVPACMT